MRGWFGDLWRTVIALWYWNARKTVFVLRGRPEPCPCQHPSDSGLAFQTGCEASSLWHSRERFARRVCPLLRRDSKGRWVCGADAAHVRPFWGRTFRYYGAGALVAAAALGVTAFGGMRVVGYKVSLRQIFWPPAWEELNDVRAQYFVTKAEGLIAKGDARAAALALTSAYETNPHSYAIGMTIAQFYLVWRRDLVDRVYEDLMKRHPEHRLETANAWLHSLLARSELEGVAKLAHDQLVAKSGDPIPWTHALVMAGRLLNRPNLLEATADDRVPPEVRDVLLREARSQRLPEAEARRLLFQEGAVSQFAYANYERVDRLLGLGDATEALVLLQSAQRSLAGRDVARFALAAYAVAGNDFARRREAQALLAANGGEPASIGLVALHLIRYPDSQTLEACIAAVQRPAFAGLDGATDAILATYFAAVSAGTTGDFSVLRDMVAATKRSNAKTLESFEQTLRSDEHSGFDIVIPLVQPMALELNYALLERDYLTKQGRK